MQKHFFKHLWLIALFMLSGCATPGSLRLKNLDIPLARIQAAVDASLPLGRRKVSPNGREFFSKYFIPQGRKIRSVKKDNKRYYAHVLILGDRRPYVIEVIVHLEKRSGTRLGKPTFKGIATDQSMAKTLARRIQRQLSKRQEDLNVIDDFRVF